MKFNLNNRTDLVTLAVVLAIFGAVAAALLGWVAEVTRAPIDAAAERRKNAALAEVLPPGFVNAPSSRKVTVAASDQSGVDVSYYAARDAAGDIIGIAGQSRSKKGYSGDVEVLVGLTPEGKVRTVAPGRSGVLITAHQETPGLGSVVADRKQPKTITTLFDQADGLPGNALLDQFADRGAPADTNWKIGKDGGEFAYKTGATITSRAVTEAVGRIVDTYNAHQIEIMSELRSGGE